MTGRPSELDARGHALEARERALRQKDFLQMAHWLKIAAMWDDLVRVLEFEKRQDPAIAL